MKPSIQTLGHILYSPSQYVIPVFQRNYRWETEQWEKLWDNLIEIQGTNKTGNHFMGFLVFVPGLAQPGQHTTFHLIDGQQRLATSSILLAAVRNVAQQAGETDLEEEINEYYLVHPKKSGDQRYRLLPKDSDRESYLALIDRQATQNGRMGRALDYFEERVSNYAAGKPERLRDIFNTVCQRFEFMCATLETENAYSIFKSLNSTGVPLSHADLIRNFVYMHLPPAEHDEFDARLWQPLEQRFVNDAGILDGERFSKFFRDVLMSSKEVGYVAPSATFERFEARYEATNFSPRHLATDLTRQAKHYAIIAGKQPDQSSAVTQALAALNQLESSTTYPLLLALFELRSNNIIDSDRLAEAVRMLSGFILRRFICGESSRGYGQIFVRAVAELDDDVIKSLEYYLIRRGWPDDRRFETAFVEFPLYQRGYTRQVLMALEQARGHKEPAVLMAAQIEHILPQTLNDAWRNELGVDAETIHADWLHRPGNLTLSAYNQELLNHPFAKKRARYAASNIGLTRELAGYSHWTAAEIARRGGELAKQAAQIWIGPQLPPAVQTVGKRKTNANGLTARKQLYVDYWTAFNTRMKGQNKLKIRRKPQPRYWADVPIGRRHVVLNPFIDIDSRYVGVSLAIWGPKRAELFQQLFVQKEAIEADLGEPLNWHEPSANRVGSISLHLRNTDPTDRKLWPEQHKWMFEKLLVFDRCFKNRVRLLTD